ncbi:MAG: NPCBM/NEW2 domain-containing protein, partial [Clostridium sp.]
SLNINRAIDGDMNTNWHSGKQNSSSHTNEVVITLDELTKIDRIMYTSLNNRGFLEGFEIYASRTTEGETFEKVTAGSITRDTQNIHEIKFKETEVRRVKIVFKKGYENWALISELGLYKSDTTREQFERLFIDEDMTEVNAEFATEAALKALEEGIKGHPFEEEYDEKLKIAKDLVEFGKVAVGTPNIERFEAFYTDYIESYDEAYRVNISKISNNGGKYGSSTIDKAIDGDANSHWETGSPNSDSFKNEVILTLEEAQEISRLTYKSRGGGKGFAEEFSIYVSPVATGDNFQKITEGKHSVTNDMLEINFNNVKAKRVKFVFDKARDNWASISDMRVYKEDAVSKAMKNLFTDGLRTELTEEFNTIEKVLELEEAINTHPLAKAYKDDIKEAKDIINGTVQTVEIVEAEQHGDRHNYSHSVLKFGFGNNNGQPTGIVARAGEKITVYVDGEEGAPLPYLVFSQQEGSFANYGRSVNLNYGKNEIIVPQTTQEDGWYAHDVTPGGAIYIVNPYTEEQQGKAPRIRFATGCEEFPFVDKNTNDEEFLEFLKDYKARVDEDAKANPNVMDRKMIDVVEVVSDHLVFTGTASGAYEAYVNQGFKPSDTVKMYNKHMDMIFNYYGLDGSSEVHDIKYARENIRLAQPFGFMYASGSHIGVPRGVMTEMLTSVGGWGVDHEIGHRMDMGIRSVGEVTNNMIPQFSSYFYEKPNRRIEFDNYTYKNVIATDNNEFYKGGYFEQLAVFWQLEMIYPGYWAELNKYYRENNITLDPQNPDLDKLNMLARISGIVLKKDLTEHFERHGFYVSDETKEILSKYEKPEIKTWYANYSYYEYKGEGLSENPSLELELTNQDDKLKLEFNVDKKYTNDILGYEILKNGEVIGFTSSNSFVDTTTTAGENVNYTVIPYDKKLKAGKGIEINSLIPRLKLQQEKVYIQLREEFNPMDFVKGLTFDNEDISEKVKCTSNVDSSKKGIYNVTYTLEDNEVTTTKTLEVEVVSQYSYLSDREWKSVYTDFGTPRRNSNIKGRVNGGIKEFEKGFYIHANGNIVYDLSGLDYDNFEALVGVDMNIAAQNNSSITFKIFGDGVELASTKVIKHADDMVHINVPVKGVKELKIEITNGGNGNTADHGVIANPKVTNNNGKPTLNIPKSQSTKIGEPIKLEGGYDAFDSEDGDITSKVKVTGDVNFNKAGEYTLTYKVSDSDGNEVKKTRTIAVVHMDDFKYLTDYEWKSTSNSYRAPNVDKSISSNDIRLTGKNGENIVYERGIGAHSNSTIIYDLKDKNYDYFTSYVGVDRQMFGSVGSVTFEVWVDGEKKFDSGLMNSRDPQKYVEVDINGAKELKLVVTDGGNGNGSDHASFGDAKLHYANENRVDLTEVVTFEDEYLKADIKKALNLNTEDITIGDMHKLTSLEGSGYVYNLKGLEYAINLETLNIDYNEVRDLSPLKNLKKLKNFSGEENCIFSDKSKNAEGKYIFNDFVVDIDGEKLLPTKIMLNPNTNPVEVNLEDVKFDGTNVIIDESIINGAKTIELEYKSKTMNYQFYILYFIDYK